MKQQRGVSNEALTVPLPEAMLPVNNSTTHNFLERFGFEYILAQVRRVAVVYPKMAQPDFEDIAQDVHFHFWLKVSRHTVTNPEAYIARMVHNKCIDMVRKGSHGFSLQPLQESENKEIMEEHLIVPSEGMADPADVVERQLLLDERIDEVAKAISTLPPRQKVAMVCAVLDLVDSPPQFVEALHVHKVHVDEAHWPKDKTEKRLLKASLSVARRSIAACLKLDLSLYKRTRRSRSLA